MELYKKHRPKSLKDIYGNKETVDSLTKYLNGTKDYQEINVANDNGINTIRALRKSMSFSPQESPFRIFVLDEAHQLTAAAQDAFLKDSEDTPKHVKIILCTTDPGKLKPTLRGRCQQFRLEQLNDSQMVKLLKDVCKKEKEKVDKEVLKVIATDSLGYSRNALQTLDKVLATDPENRLKIAKQTILVKNQSIDLCFAMMGWKKAGWKEVQAILIGLKGQEPETIRRAVIGYAASQLLKKDDKKLFLVLDEFIEPFYSSGFPGLVYAAYCVTKR
jgi:DNA polymerase III gamma/tau subunit